MNKSFDQLFKNLLTQITNLYSKEPTSDNRPANRALDRVLKYINTRERDNIKVNIVKKTEISNASDGIFVDIDDYGVNYNTYLIKVHKKKIKSLDNNKYDDFSYTLYILHTIIRKVKEYNLIKKIQSYNFEDNMYCNALLLALNESNLSKYKKNPLIGKASYESTRLILDLFERDCKDKEIMLEFKQKLKNYNIFTTKVYWGIAKYWLEQIPFVFENNEFINIVKYGNDNISKLPYREKKAILKKYPQLCLGLNVNGNIKTPEVIINEYFKNEISGNHTILTLEDLDREYIKNIYIYLLIPYINRDICEKICKNYYNGEEKLNRLLIEIKEKITKKKELYIKAATEANKNLYNITNATETLKRNETHINNKLYASIEFLNNCQRIIDDCLQKEKAKIRK